MTPLKIVSRVACALAALLAFGNPAHGNALDPGFDLLSTPTGGAAIDFTGTPLDPSIVGQKVVELEGNPFGPGNTDTVVQRLGGLGDGETGLLPAVIVALSRRSVNPVELLLPTGGTSFFDVFVTLDPTRASTGEIEVTSHDDGGGLVDSFFDVFFLVDIPGFLPGPVPFQDVVSATDTPWSHTPPSGYPFGGRRFPPGGFFITSAGIDHDSGPQRRTLPASVPEPASLVLLGLGLGLLALGRSCFGGRFAVASSRP